MKARKVKEQSSAVAKRDSEQSWTPGTQRWRRHEWKETERQKKAKGDEGDWRGGDGRDVLGGGKGSEFQKFHTQMSAPQLQCTQSDKAASQLT